MFLASTAISLAWSADDDTFYPRYFAGPLRFAQWIAVGQRAAKVEYGGLVPDLDGFSVESREN
jgi:hypothetical protein